MMVAFRYVGRSATTLGSDLNLVSIVMCAFAL